MAQTAHRDEDFVSQEWAVPRGAQTFRLPLPASDAGLGLTLAVVGVYVPGATPPYEWPALTLRSSADDEDATPYALQVWRRVVRCEGSPAAVVAMWHPHHGQRTFVQGLESLKTYAEVCRTRVLFERGLQIVGVLLQGEAAVGDHS